MEELLTKVGELVSTELDGVDEVCYLDREMGYMFCFIYGGKKILLSLLDIEGCSASKE